MVRTSATITVLPVRVCGTLFSEPQRQTQAWSLQRFTRCGCKVTTPIALATGGNQYFFWFFFRVTAHQRGLSTAPTVRIREQKDSCDPAKCQGRSKKQVLRPSRGRCWGQEGCFWDSFLLSPQWTRRPSRKTQASNMYVFRCEEKKAPLLLLTGAAKSPTSWHIGFSGEDMLSQRERKSVFRMHANDFTKLFERSRSHFPAPTPPPEYLVSLESCERVLSTAIFTLTIFKLTL